MITGTVWGITLILVAFAATLVAGQLLLGTVFARRLERSRGALRERPWIATVLGLVLITLVLVAVSVLGQAKGLGQLLAALVGVVAGAAAVLGLGVVSREIGERMPSAAASPWRALLRGAVTLVLSFHLPVLGWIVLLPLSLAAGLGSLVLSARTAESPDAAVPATSPGSAA